MGLGTPFKFPYVEEGEVAVYPPKSDMFGLVLSNDDAVDPRRWLLSVTVVNEVVEPEEEGLLDNVAEELDAADMRGIFCAFHAGGA